jgi:hypothetical protein
VTASDYQHFDGELPIFKAISAWYLR